ncbi:MAG: hypothetical protein V3T22_10420 [Planctomycetota bacterium]
MKSLTIWKYPLQTMVRSQTIEVPAGARVLHADIQSGAVTVWALVDPDEALRERIEVWVMGTGHPFAESFAGSVPVAQDLHVCTVMDDPFVWHVFARTLRTIGVDMGKGESVGVEVPTGA